MKPRFITFLFLLAAIAFYFAGLVLPAVGLILLGMAAETVFWFRLLVRRSRDGG